ncbi:chain length determinant protein EpsF [Chitinibacteraceae bacterium HSL-7]
MSFEQFLSILRARKVIALLVFAVVVVSTILVSLILPKQYSSDATIAVDVKAVDPVTGSPVAGYLAPSFMATQVDLIQSQSAALKVVDGTGLAGSPEVQQQWRDATDGRGNVRNWLADSLLKGLQVQPSRESNVITIEYTAADPKFAAAMANAFANAYMQTVADIKTAGAAQNNRFFEGQMKTLQKKLEQSQLTLSNYQQEQGIVASDERLDIETQRLNELSSQLAAAQGMVADAKSRTRGGSVAPDVLNNPLIQSLKSQLAMQQAKFDELAAKNGPNHPHYQAAKAELDATRSQLSTLMGQYAGGLNSAAGNAVTREADLAAALEEQKQRVLELKSQRSRLDVLQRDLDNAQRTYDGALQRLSQTALESQANQTNVVVIKTAIEPLKHSSPKLLLNTLLALFVGGMLGIGFAMLAELIDRRVRAVADIEIALAVPVLAVLDSHIDTPKRLFGFRRSAA